MALKDQIINGIIDREGGYVNDPSDSGGETMYGITVAVARKYGYSGRMAALPRDLAFQIYEALYWKSLSLDQVEAVAPRVAAEMADTGVNMGVARAAGFLQRSLNVLNREQSDFNDLAVDQKIGGGTIMALRFFIQQRGAEGESVLVSMLNCLQGAFYVELAEKRQKDERFVYGWFLHRVSL
jgi:lysozyme family protein